MHLQPNTTLQNGKLTIIKKLGSGGFGITYLAEHSLLGKVALKEFFLSTANKYCTRSNKTVIPAVNLNNLEFDKFKQDFIEEAKTLNQLRDIPNIVNVYDYFEENNTVYFYMEYIKGEPLQSIVDRTGQLPVEIAIKYIRQIAEALIEVHKKGILHRDIKPENIIINNQDNAILIDFGIARDFVEGETKTHTGMATMGYAPPEQLMKRTKRGAYTDIYSLGGTLYFCLTGQRPQTLSEINIDGFISARDLNPTVTHKVNKIIIKATKQKPEKRFQNIEAFLENLSYGKSKTGAKKIVKSVAKNTHDTQVLENQDKPTINSSNKKRKIAKKQKDITKGRFTIKTRQGKQGIVNPSDEIVIPFYFEKIVFEQNSIEAFFDKNLNNPVVFDAFGNYYSNPNSIFRKNPITKRENKKTIIWIVSIVVLLIINSSLPEEFFRESIVYFRWIIVFTPLLMIFVRKRIKDIYMMSGISLAINWGIFILFSLLFLHDYFLSNSLSFDDDDHLSHQLSDIEFNIMIVLFIIFYLSTIFINQKIKKVSFAIFTLLSWFVIAFITFFIFAAEGDLKHHIPEFIIGVLLSLLPFFLYTWGKEIKNEYLFNHWVN